MQISLLLLLILLAYHTSKRRISVSAVLNSWLCMFPTLFAVKKPRIRVATVPFEKFLLQVWPYHDPFGRLFADAAQPSTPCRWVLSCNLVTCRGETPRTLP